MAEIGLMRVARLMACGCVCGLMGSSSKPNLKTLTPVSWPLKPYRVRGFSTHRALEWADTGLSERPTS
ncbi:hypothetical protein RRG08_029373 [Elysia crispata]|uniref:Uncharacterized protein n=1 Tax=Elysia crispata TaxID=231223 RepID=A0AAE1B7N7_9GAST|nr:hypothetical protein RRG08_029373 [Elysia crispata]